MSGPLLETRALSLHAAGRCLVRGLDWRVLPGERWCLIGRNAAGKSTLLRALAGLAVPGREGEILWLGRPQRDWQAADAASVRAFAPQQANDRFAISVQRLIELSRVRSSALTPQSVLAALEARPLLERSVLQLSGGERQRVALAQAALQGAPLLLLDEPVSFQDPGHQGTVARWLGDWAPVGGERAWVASAHDVNWISRAATHVLALLGDGAWRAGRSPEVIDAAMLREVYRCDWRDAGGVWVSA